MTLYSHLYPFHEGMTTPLPASSPIPFLVKLEDFGAANHGPRKRSHIQHIHDLGVFVQMDNNVYFLVHEVISFCNFAHKCTLMAILYFSINFHSLDTHRNTPL